MSKTKQDKIKEVEDHNRRYDKVLLIRKLLKGTKEEWRSGFFSVEIREELLDNWIESCTLLNKMEK